MGKKAYEESNIANIAVAIRKKTQGDKTYKTSEMPSGINEVYDKGCTDGYNEGYTKGDSEGYDKGLTDGKNSVVDFGKFCNVIRFKSLNVFKDKEVTLNLDNVTSLEQLCSTGESNYTVEHLIINCPNLVTSCWNMVRNAGVSRYLKRLSLNVNTNLAESFVEMVRYQTELEVIDGDPLDCTSAKNFHNMFFCCYELKDVKFVPLTLKVNFAIPHSPNLSPETIQSIIDGLADLTGQTAQTLTLHADVGAKLTDEQKVTITAKNWILAY